MFIGNIYFWAVADITVSVLSQKDQRGQARIYSNNLSHCIMGASLDSLLTSTPTTTQTDGGWQLLPHLMWVSLELFIFCKKLQRNDLHTVYQEHDLLS